MENKLRLRKGYWIKNDRGREGIITEYGYKNGERTISFEAIEEDRQPKYWCYKSQIVQVYKDREMIYNKNG